MHATHPARTFAIALFILAVATALVLAGLLVLGMQLTPLKALAAAAVVAILFAGIAWLHDAHRAARWNAGYRVR